MLAVALCLLAVACQRPAGERPAVSQEALLRRIETQAEFLLLDVRTPKEYRSGHIPGAINIPHIDLAGRIGELGKHRQADVIVYCERGGRAAVAEAALREHGFSSVFHLEGDMSAWRANGRPTNTEAQGGR